MPSKYCIGIDLGTTNSVLAYSSLESDQPRVEVLQVPQLVASGTVESRTMLPSFMYLGLEHEARSGAFDVPWAAGRNFAVGEYARRQGAEVPDRTVGTAKSWLCYSRVDRRQPILPWNAPAEVPKVSPVTASQRYLEHLAAAWETAFPHAPLAEQYVVLTVPASFDASARELTREAALAAGLPAGPRALGRTAGGGLRLAGRTGDRWRRLLKVGDTLLVCDVGGGTTDLTPGRTGRGTKRIGLAADRRGQSSACRRRQHGPGPGPLCRRTFRRKRRQTRSLAIGRPWHSCRAAKEILLTPEGPEKHSVAVLGRGRKLIGGTVSVEVDRRIVSDLCWRVSSLDAKYPTGPVQKHVSGFREIGLPFQSDTAVTRHLAAFLEVQGRDEGNPVRPTHVLFNGGVFKADVLRKRLLDVLGDWFAAPNPPKLLEGEHDLDHAAARGAAYYGWTKHRGGVRIRGGTARSYYVGIETAGLAVPGARGRSGHLRRPLRHGRRQPQWTCPATKSG